MPRKAPIKTSLDAEIWRCPWKYAHARELYWIESYRGGAHEAPWEAVQFMAPIMVDAVKHVDATVQRLRIAQIKQK